MARSSSLGWLLLSSVAILLVHSTQAGRIGPAIIDPTLLESADVEVLDLGLTLSDDFGLALPENATNARRLLQQGCSDQNFQNPCYASDGSSYVCCAGSCGDFNGNQPTCRGGESSTQNGPPRANFGNNQHYNPPDNPEMIDPNSAFPLPLGSSAAPITGGYCPTAMCYVADGSVGFCCLTQCPANPKKYPYCSGDRIGFAPNPPTAKPTKEPQTSAPTAGIQEITDDNQGPNQPVTDGDSEQPGIQTPSPTATPSATPSATQTGNPTSEPTPAPTENPNSAPTGTPVDNPIEEPTQTQSPNPTETPKPTATDSPTSAPAAVSETNPSAEPTSVPTPNPTDNPTGNPTPAPTESPTSAPTENPTPAPTSKPVDNPTSAPTNSPTTASPTANPTANPGRDRLTNSYWLVPGNSAPAANEGWLEISESFTNPQNEFGLDESAVFFRSLKHHGGREWEMHVGPSGHVYSITTPASGGAELVCCQAPQTQWMDRVLQSVVSDLRYPGNHFLQQAGSYPQGSSNQFPFYSPNLGVTSAALDGRGISTVTLPQQAPIYHHGMTDKNFWQWVVQQQHLKDIGNGVVEITYVFHNFGPFDLHFIDAPWGGFAANQFPQYAVGDKDGGYHFEDHSHEWEYTPPADSASGGWMAFAKTQEADADAIGIVYAPSQTAQPWPENLIRFGKLWSENLNVIEHIHMNTPWETAPAALPAGGVFYARYYMVLNTLGSIAGAVPDLQKHVSKGRLTYSPEETGFSSVSAPVPVTNWFPIDRPLPHSLPLFLLKYVSSGKYVVSTSPYAFYNTDHSLSPDPRNTEYISFLGWGVKDTGNGAPQGLGETKLLSKILSQDWFPDPYWGDADVKADVWVGV